MAKSKVPAFIIGAGLGILAFVGLSKAKKILPPSMEVSFLVNGEPGVSLRTGDVVGWSWNTEGFPPDAFISLAILEADQLPRDRFVVDGLKGSQDLFVYVPGTFRSGSFLTVSGLAFNNRGELIGEAKSQQVLVIN